MLNAEWSLPAAKQTLFHWPRMLNHYQCAAQNRHILSLYWRGSCRRVHHAWFAQEETRNLLYRVHREDFLAPPLEG